MADARLRADLAALGSRPDSIRFATIRPLRFASIRWHLVGLRGAHDRRIAAPSLLVCDLLRRPASWLAAVLLLPASRLKTFRRFYSTMICWPDDTRVLRFDAAFALANTTSSRQ